MPASLASSLPSLFPHCLSPYPSVYFIASSSGNLPSCNLPRLNGSPVLVNLCPFHLLVRCTQSLLVCCMERSSVPCLQTSGQPCLPAVNEIRYEKKFEKFAKKEKNMKISHKIQVKKG